MSKSADGFELIDSDDAFSESDSEMQATLAQVLAWLAPTSYDAESSEFKKHLLSYVKGTGQWLRSTPQYTSWRESASSLLWVKGIPGSGKSVVAASAIKDLQDAPVVYFFFRHIIAANRTPKSLVRDWLAQLLPHSKILVKRIETLMHSNRNLENVSFNTLWNIFTAASARMPKIYCVADALDEMEVGNEDFLQKLLELGTCKATIKVLITSRPSPHIEKIFQSVPQIRLDPANIHNDVDTFVQHRLNTIPDEEGLDKEAIRENVCTRANGLFLYARLMVDELISVKNKGKTANLPQSLDQMYSTLLREHSSRSGATQQTQFLILQWVTQSMRPLRLIELAAIVTALPDHRTKSLPVAKALVRSACGPLLEILRDETVQIIHHSFTEYLSNTERALDDFPVITNEESQQNMAYMCLQQLNMDLRGIPDYKPDDSLDTLFDKLHFLRYSAMYWNQHAAKCNDFKTNMVSLLDTFYSSNSNIKKWAEWTFSQSRKMRFNNEELPEFPTFHSAALLGLAPYVRLLAVRGADVEAKDKRGYTPLINAARHGHANVVSDLLGLGADPLAESAQGMTAMHYAVLRNYSAVVRKLLECGGDPLSRRSVDISRPCGNMRSVIGDTPLRYACERGDAASVSELLKHISGITLTNELWLAVENNHLNAAAALLDSGMADVNDTEGVQNSLCLDLKMRTRCLYIAALKGNLPMTELLLDRGADISLPPMKRDPYSGPRLNESNEEQHESPLFYLCNGGDAYSSSDSETEVEIARLLVQHGCKINDMVLGRTPLSRAATRNKVHLSKYLIENGADITTKTSDGKTILHLMCSSRAPKEDMLDVLLKAGVDVNAVDDKGDTALFMALDDFRNHAVLRKLLEAGADPSIRNSNGDTLLHVALSANVEENVVSLLLDCGIDPNLTNLKGETCLFMIHKCREHHADIVLKHLIAAGINIEARDAKGRTALLISAEHKSQTVRNLIEHGADAQATDLRGESIFHYLLKGPGYYKRKEVIQLTKDMIQAGANPYAIDRCGNNMLHTVGHNQDILQIKDLQEISEIKQLLLMHNGKGQTPLHIMLSKEEWYYSKFVTLFVELGADLNASDYCGVRPIHLAVKEVDLLDLLLQNGATTDSYDDDMKSTLHYAAETGNPTILLRIIQLCPSDVNHEDKDRKTALHYACATGNPECVRILLSNGATLRNHEALLKACALNSKSKRHMRDVFRLLIKEGLQANVNGYQMGAVKDAMSMDLRLESLSAGFSKDRYISDHVLLEMVQQAPEAVKTYKSNLGISEYSRFNDLMGICEEYGTQYLRTLNIDAKIKPGEPVPTNILHALCSGGHARQLRDLMEFHGTAKVKEVVHTFDQYKPLIFIAAGSNAPNCEVFELLIEAGANVNSVRIWDSETRRPDDVEYNENVGCTALHRLAKSSSYLALTCLEALLQNGADPSIKDSTQCTALHSALESKSGSAEKVALLLRFGADPNAVLSDGLTVLNIAIKNAPDAVSILLKHGADPNKGLRPAIHSAAVAGQPDILKLILDHGVDDCNARDLYKDTKTGSQYALYHQGVFFHGETALFVCLHKGRGGREQYKKTYASIELLLEAGANPWAECLKKTTIFHAFVGLGSTYEPFLKRNLDINKRDQENQTLLMAACRGISSQIGVLRACSSAAIALLEKKPDLSAVDTRSRTALHHLIDQNGRHPMDHLDNYQAVFRRLIDMGVSIGQRDDKGQTAFQFALKGNSIWTANQLLDAGADPLETDNDGCTALHILAATLAMSKKGLELWKRLLEAGCDIEAVDKLGETPVFKFVASGHPKRNYEAAKSGFKDRFGLLFAGSANLHATSLNGETVLHALARRGIADPNLHRPTDINDDTAWLFEQLVKEKGLDPMAEDARQLTPLDVAANTKNQGILDLFAQD